MSKKPTKSPSGQVYSEKLSHEEVDRSLKMVEQKKPQTRFV